MKGKIRLSLTEILEILLEKYNLSNVNCLGLDKLEINKFNIVNKEGKNFLPNTDPEDKDEDGNDIFTYTGDDFFLIFEFE